MAAYPTLNTTVNSKITVLDGVVEVRASNGSLKTRKLFSADKRQFELEHELTASQKTSLLDAHYAGDAGNSFSYTWPGTGGGTYTVRYMGAPQPVEQPGGWFKMYVRLSEV